MPSIEIETEIASWRAFVSRQRAVAGRDVDELEAHLRDQMADLHDAGLDDDEAFLVAVKRMGRLDDLSREFAREHSDRLWRQLVVVSEEESADVDRRWPEVLLFAVGAAIAVQVARLVAHVPDDDPPRWLLRNAGLLVVPFLIGWYVRRRGLAWRAALPTLGAVLVAAAVVVNGYPWHHASDTELLAAGHLPVALWFVVAWPYMGGTLRSHARRMDFVRFTGEWCIYYALIALGGGVLMGLTAGILEPTGIDPAGVAAWVLLSGAAGAVLVAAWLVESKQHVIENMAPVLTMLFTPLFAGMLAVCTAVYAVTGFGDAFDRELLGLFDALLVVVLGLVLYGMSARQPSSTAGWMDRIQLVAVISALALDVIVLVSMLLRIHDLGLTPNRVAALGLNLVLLVDLGGAAWLSWSFVRGRVVFARLERWQTSYLPVFAVWAAVVVVVLPLAFAFE
jgi:hypothetical protein